MAPRRHKRKSRLSRLDAAIDAMLPFGFAETHVRKVVKLLLKEYGGIKGWPFIEEFSYKVLIEAILRDLEERDEMKAAEHRNPVQIHSKNEIVVGFSGMTAENTLHGEELLSGLEVDRTKKGIDLGQTSRQNERETSDAAIKNNGEPMVAAHPGQSSASYSVSLNPTSPSINKSPNRTRRPCYGWIESSDEEDPEEEFVDF